MIWKSFADLIIPGFNRDGRRSFFKNYLKVIFGFNPLVCLVFTLAGDSPINHLFFFRLAFGYFIACTVASVCMWGSHLVIRAYCAYRGLKIHHVHPIHYGWRLIISNLFAPLGLYLAFAGLARYFEYMNWPPFTTTVWQYRSGIMYGLVISTLIFLLQIWRDGRRDLELFELKVKTLENETLKARLAALNYQMNPHLLFNSLNTIASMIPEKPLIAENMTVQLSELYRGILVSMRNSSHSLEKEIELVRSYLSIEHARFGERVQFQIDVDPAVNLSAIEVPVLLVQPLVENAVKHGLSPLARGGRVQVHVKSDRERISIIIDDDGVGYGNSKLMNGTGTGVTNCRQRLQIVYGAHATFEIGPQTRGTRAQIQIPHQLGGLS